jgi:hypothetical protein
MERPLRFPGRSLAAALGVVMLGSAGHAAAAPQGGDVPNATVLVDFAKTRGAFLHPERYNNFANPKAFAAQRPEDVRFYNASGLHGKVYRAWVAVQNIYDPKTGAFDYSSVDDYLAQASAISDDVLIVLDTRVAIRDEKQTPAQIKPVIRRILLDLKRKYPHIRYVEAFNEPDYNLAKVITPEQLYDFYVPYYQAVNEVNRELNPKVPLEIGGPAFMMYDEPWLSAFLDRYKGDPSPDKRLDFLSWHAYGFFEQGGGAPGQLKPYHFYKGDPSEVAGQRASLDAELRSRGLDARVPLFITESGIYPGPSFDHPKDPRPDYLIGAAGVMSLHYWYLDQPRTFPFNWVVRHTTEERKDQLVSRPGDDKPPLVDTFTPYGNAMEMMSKLKAERVAATSDSLKAGKGVYAIATKDPTGAGVMIWNYQHTGSQAYKVEVKFADLPANLRGRPLRERRFRIDDKTSNYFANPQTANLQQVSQRTFTPSTAFSETVELTPNALELIVLEPAAGPSR